MHSFVTSKSLPLGYMAQRRMSERERQRRRQQREKERESLIRVEADKKSYFVVSTKARLEKIDFQCGHGVNRREKGGGGEKKGKRKKNGRGQKVGK